MGIQIVRILCVFCTKAERTRRTLLLLQVLGNLKKDEHTHMLSVCVCVTGKTSAGQRVICTYYSNGSMNNWSVSVVL